MHNDVIKWNWPFVRGIHRSPVNFPHRTDVFDVLFNLRMNNRLGNNRDAGYLRRHRAHYDVTVMISVNIFICCTVHR